MSAKPLKSVGLLLAILVWLPMAGSAQAAQRPKSKRKPPVKQEQPAPTPQPAPPPPPPTLEQMPASAPRVSFRNGQLTIAAENSTLADILRAVRAQTGAAVEIPSNATERVVSHLGPGPARDVLASLLNGSHFNYVMLGSPTNPAVVERIVLISKAGAAPDSGSPPPENAANQPAYPQPQVAAGAAQIVQEPEEMPNEESADDSGEANQPENQEGPQPGQQPGGQQIIKTPEQLLQELQRQQQQQQQGPPQSFPTPQNQPPQPQNQPPQ